MEQLTWLHLSDLHRGQPGEAGRWPAARSAALADMRAMAQDIGAPDVILFTGDLAFSGQDEEYRKVEETLQEIREAVTGDPLVITVPGNHDLARPGDGDPAAAGFDSYLGSERPALRRSLLTARREATEPIDRIFAAYKRFWDRVVKPSWDRRGSAVRYQLGLLPGDFLLTLDKAGLCVGIAGVNSAFLQQRGDPPGSDEHYKGKLVVEPEQLGIATDLDRWSKEHDAALLLMHHPPDWLHNRRAFETNVYHPSWFTACLFGHMHEGRYQEERSDGPAVRRYLQAGSLFGLEQWGQRHERHDLGYAWGRITRTAEAAGELTQWRRRGGLNDLRTWELEAGRAAPPRAIALRRREARTGLRAAVVAVTSELAAQRQAIANQLRRFPGVGEVSEVRAEQAGALAGMEAVDLVVVLLGWSTGGDAGVLQQALGRDAVVLRWNVAPPAKIEPSLLVQGHMLRQRRGDAVDFDGSEPSVLAAKVRDEVARWFERRSPHSGDLGIGLRPFERAYLQQLKPVWEQGKQGPLSSMARSDNNRNLDRSKLYISVRAEPGIYDWVDGKLQVLAPGAALTPPKPGEPQELAFVETVLSQPDLPYLVVEGEAGCGKTVMLQHVALVLAQTHLGEPLAQHRLDLDALTHGQAMPPVPFLFEAQALSRGFPADAGAGDLVAALTREVRRLSGSEVKEAELLAGLQSGRYVLLIDSLDEIADTEQRAALAGCLEGLSSRSDWRGRIVLTTRPSAFTGNGTFGGRLRKLRVARLGDKDTAAMAERYCAAFGHSAAYQQQMLAAIEEVTDRHGGANLAENPLMLTVTMLVFEAQQRLPDSTAELYHSIVDILCKIRRHRDMPPGLRRQALERVFEGAQRAGTTEWPVAAATALLCEKMPGLFPTPQVARERLDQLAAETGLLRFEKRPDAEGRPQVVLRAWHRSFQEYLCACSIAGSEDAVATATDRLMERSPGSGELIVEDPFWEGVLRFLVGVYGSVKAERARACVERLYEHAHGRAGVAAPTRQGRILGLVATGLAEYKEHFGGHPLIEQIRHEVVEAFEAGGNAWPLEDRLLAFNAVGRLGDPRLDRPLWVDVPGGEVVLREDSKFAVWGLAGSYTVAPFKIAFRPVTVTDFKRFVDAGGFQDPRWWPEGLPEIGSLPRWERQRLHPNHAVIDVNRQIARAFCRWATERGPWPIEDGHEIDLPSLFECVQTQRAAVVSDECLLFCTAKNGTQPIGIACNPESASGEVWDMHSGRLRHSPEIVRLPASVDLQRRRSRVGISLAKGAFSSPDLNGLALMIISDVADDLPLFVTKFLHFTFRLACRPKAHAAAAAAVTPPISSTKPPT